MRAAAIRSRPRAAISICDVVDMEAYALAKVCRVHGADFLCVKYVTDGADHAAAADWHDNVHEAAAEFLTLYHGVLGGLSRVTLAP